MKRICLPFLAASILTIVSPPAHAKTIKDHVYHFTIVHTNDHHGRFWKNNDGEYGLSAQKTAIDRIRAEVKASGGQILVLSGGDINTGVPESDMQDAEPDFKGMSQIGFDAMVLGNHEFDNPLPVLAKQQKWATFPFLSANIYRAGRPMFEAYRMFNKGGLKIAVLGLTTNDTQKMVSPDNLAYSDTWKSGRVINPKSAAGLEFRSPIEVAARWVPVLRTQADVVIAATHMGHYTNGNHGSNAPGDVEMARAVNGIDLIVGGHSQNPVCMKAENDRNDAYVPGGECTPDRQNSAWIVQAHEWGKYVGRADFTFKNGLLALDHYALIPINLKKSIKSPDGATTSKVLYTEEISENPDMLTFLKPFQDKGQKTLMLEVGSTRGALDGDRSHVRAQPTNLGTLIATSMMEKVKADFAVMNSGGVRDSIANGIITYKDILKVQPFGNTIVYADLTGQEVQSYMNAMATMTPGSGAFPQFAGIQAVFENGIASEIRINHTPMDLNKTYRIALNDFAASGGDGYPKLKSTSSYVNTGFNDADVLKAYISKNSPIDASKFQPNGEIVRVSPRPQSPMK